MMHHESFKSESFVKLEKRFMDRQLIKGGVITM